MQEVLHADRGVTSQRRMNGRGVQSDLNFGTFRCVPPTFIAVAQKAKRLQTAVITQRLCRRPLRH